MVPADDARCARHPDEPADGTCQRCGSFTCERCTRFGVERRCPACRPRVSESIHAERRDNAVRRSANVRCLACGYAGPRLDLHRSPRWAALAALPLSALLGPVGFMVGLSTLAPTHPCPACASPDEVVPASAELIPTTEATQAWAQAHARSRPASRQVLVWAYGLAALASLGFWGLALVELLLSS